MKPRDFDTSVERHPAGGWVVRVVRDGALIGETRYPTLVRRPTALAVIEAVRSVLEAVP